LLSQSVQRVVSLTSGSNVTGESESGVVSSDGTSFLINVSNVNLNGGVVFSLDNSVGGRALAWNVKFNLEMLVFFELDQLTTQMAV